MKGIVGKKKSNDRDEIRQISESKNNEMFRPHRRGEHSNYSRHKR